MLKGYFGTGLVIQGTVTGFCSYSASHGEVWLPLLLGVLGLLPLASGWAKALVEGQPMLDEPLGRINDLRRDINELARLTWRFPAD